MFSNGFLLILLLSIPSIYTQSSRRRARNECSDRSCFPISGNLLIGREANLTTDSTCGLNGKETYCNLINVNRFERDLNALRNARSECYVCDSRNPNGKNSHRIENIVSLYKKRIKDRWWQAESEKNEVYIQLDLEAEFHVTHVLMTFRTFRPSSMLIERSSDFGQTWNVYRYFAHECKKSWPGVALEPDERLFGAAYCEQLDNPGIPSTGAELVMKILSPNKHISDPYSEEVQNLIKITNLRINFTKLFTLGDNLLGSKKQSYYYALYNLVVSGFCSCYGHADQCIPLHEQSAQGMVYGKCKCNHHTTGHNCERCLPFYQDLPWRPAHGEQKNECQKCNCNNHSHKCHFDPAVFEANNQESGGVCDDCQDNTMGQNCDQCMLGYYRNPHVPHDHVDTCLQCDCDPRGSMNIGECDSFTDRHSGMVAGRCACKRLVTGPRCDTCVAGYFDLDSNNPDGCRACSCDRQGTVEGFECEANSGECRCKRFVTGRTCDVCMKGYWGLSDDPQGCKSCNCDVGGSIDSQCDAFTGQCRCRPHITGKHCNQIEEGYYYPLLDWLLYEAELSRPVGEVELENRERGDEIWWTGSGFMRVHERASLEFLVDNIPFSMDYDLLVRYEAKMSRRWDDVRVQVEKVSGGARSGSSCHNHVPADDHKSFSIDPFARHVLVSPPSCLEVGVVYKITLTFPEYHNYDDMFLYIDSIVLLPANMGHPIFENSDHQEISNIFKRYRCIDSFFTPQSSHSSRTPHFDECKNLVFSSSVAIHNGAKACDCNPVGAEVARCDVRGGQCRCRPNVIGRKCDKCSPLHYGLTNHGCVACACHIEGSLVRECDQRTGKCPCKPHAYGQQCGNCQKGFWGFPNCRPCECSGRAEDCENDTGKCIRCRDNSGGDRCEKCGFGFYGDFRIGCQPCPCPFPGSANAESCEVSANSVVCRCSEGYTGERCERCVDGYYGDPMQGGQCKRCSCHGNIDPNDPQACDSTTGECKRCLYNTEGRHCERCKPGFYGDALKKSCIPCACNVLGTREDQMNLCDPLTGVCHCKPHVVGNQCNACQKNYWKIASGKGCEPCGCDAVGSYSSQCDQFTGECRCRAGRGGRDCSQCSDLYWGNPTVQCQRCRCNPQGSVSQQCDKQTGKCECKKGVAGYLCSRCSKGATGSLPNCKPCGPCYDAWEKVIEEMNAELNSIVTISRGIEASGGGNSFLRELNEMTTRIQKIRFLLEVNTSPWEGDLDRLYHNLHELRMNITYYDKQLYDLETQGQNTSVQLYGLSDRLNNINHRIDSVLRIVFELKLNATGIQEKDMSGAFNSIKESYSRSNKVRNNVHNYADTRYRAQQTRLNADRMINIKKNQVDHSNSINGHVITQLSHEVSNSKQTIMRLNSMVCDAKAFPCDPICGGAGCGHCGRGMSCQNGVVYKTSNAHEFARQASDVANAKRSQVDNVVSKVAYNHQQCFSMKQMVDKVYREAAKLYNASSSSDVSDFIEEMHTFMKDIVTYPNHVRELAQVVLAFRIKPTERDITELSRKIITILSSLTNIDHIIHSTRDTLEEVNNLKNRAERARGSAEAAKAKVHRTASTLHQTSRIQHRVDDSLRLLRTRLNQITGEIGKIGNLSTFGSTDFTQYTSHNVASNINLMKQKIFKNEADVRKILQTVKNTEEITNKIKQISKEMEENKRDFYEDVLAKWNEVLELEERIQAVKNKADTFRTKMSGWESFTLEWAEKFSMRKKRLTKWKQETLLNMGNAKQLVLDIRKAERYLKHCGTA